MQEQTGRCLCGAIHYRVTAQPVRVSFCHCRFCQRVTGGPYAVEPIFRKAEVQVTGEAKSYDHVSAGSGKVITTHFCPTCGANLFYTFERFAEFIGVQAGTFDDPNWFSYDAGNAKHIFLDDARRDTLIPAGLPCFRQHSQDKDGNPVEPVIYDRPRPVRET